MRKLLTIALLLVCMATVAQTKKVTTSNSKFAVIKYEEEIKKVATAPDKIYFMEIQHGNNAIWSIDRATGKIATTIEGVDGTYEKRTRIQDIGVLPNGKLIYASAEDIGLKIFDGKSDETSQSVWKPEKRIAEIKMIVGPTGYIYLRTNQSEYILNPQFKQIAKFSSLNFGTWTSVDKDGNVWLADLMNIVKVDSLGRKVGQVFKIGNEPLKNGDLSGAMLSPDNRFYVSSKRYIYRSTADGTSFEIAAKIPNNDVNNTFKTILVTPAGDFYTTSNHYESGIFEYGKDIASEPKNGKKLTSDCGEQTSSFSTKTTPILFEFQANNLYSDADGNVIYITNYPYRVYIYNPAGIKGLTGLKGKYTSPKK